MAASFGSYSPVVPLNTTWQETIQLLQDDGVTPIDLTGLAVHAQLRPIAPLSAAGIPTTIPIIEFTTTGFYSPAPSWPVVVAFTVPTPTNGTILLNVPQSDYSAIVSPTNAKAKLAWEVRLVNLSTGYVQPVLAGKIVFLPAVTV